MRKVVRFLAWWATLFATCHVIQIAVMQAPESLQLTLSLAWLLVSTPFALALSAAPGEAK